MFKSKIAVAASAPSVDPQCGAEKSHLHRLTMLTCLVVLATTGHPSHAADTLIAEVNGMVCAFCAQGIEHKLRKQAQPKDVYINLGRRVVALELKDGQTFSVASFKTVIEDAGYAVVATSNDTRSVQEIRAAFSKK